MGSAVRRTRVLEESQEIHGNIDSMLGTRKLS